MCNKGACSPEYQERLKSLGGEIMNQRQMIIRHKGHDVDGECFVFDGDAVSLTMPQVMKDGSIRYLTVYPTGRFEDCPDGVRREVISPRVQGFNFYVDEKVSVERERDSALRAHEYAVISHDKKGVEVEVLTFYVTDSGHFHFIKKPAPLVDGKRA